jgi:hypothetical protein
MRTTAAVSWQPGKFQDLLRDEDLKSLNVMRHGRSFFLFYGGPMGAAGISGRLRGSRWGSRGFGRPAITACMAMFSRWALNRAASQWPALSDEERRPLSFLSMSCFL